jgi:hypothetical protein
MHVSDLVSNLEVFRFCSEKRIEIGERSVEIPKLRQRYRAMPKKIGISRCKFKGASKLLHCFGIPASSYQECYGIDESLLGCLW